MKTPIIPKVIIYKDLSGGRCCYLFYSKEQKKMVECGIQSIGNGKGNELCKEHFDYFVQMNGIPKSEIKQDFYKPNGKNGR